MKTKTILITGGTSGIGREIALLLCEQGHHVYAASRKPPAEPMPGVIYVPLDVQSAESIQACVQSVLSQAGQIDVLINNAGYLGRAKTSEEIAIEEVRALFETNFFGVVQMVNAVLPGMRARRKGLIINIGSAAGRMAVPEFFGFYVASKHALEGYSKALSADLRPLGIRVAVVEPGYFRTNLHNTLHLPNYPLDDFAEKREHIMALDAFSLRHGRDPRIVARRVARLVHGPILSLRHPVGPDVLYAIFIHTILPEKLAERFLSWFLGGGQPVKLTDDDATLRRKMGFRRYMLDSAVTDRWVRVVVVMLVFLAGVELFFLLK
jgi:NAD(P)-dependent dehydrogenase (short-subunit alcohol dehydrogenase family)